jgi:hypothetical protein
VITRQLVGTARTLGAEWWQVCGEAWVRGQSKMSQVMGAFGLLGFTMLRPILAWRAFWNICTVYFFNFPKFLSGRGKPRITETADTESADTGVHLYCFYWLSKALFSPLNFIVFCPFACSWYLTRTVLEQLRIYFETFTHFSVRLEFWDHISQYCELILVAY